MNVHLYEYFVFKYFNQHEHSCCQNVAIKTRTKSRTTHKKIKKKKINKYFNNNKHSTIELVVQHASPVHRVPDHVSREFSLTFNTIAIF